MSFDFRALEAQARLPARKEFAGYRVVPMAHQVEPAPLSSMDWNALKPEARAVVGELTFVLVPVYGLGVGGMVVEALSWREVIIKENNGEKGDGVGQKAQDGKHGQARPFRPLV